jgi:hypothetical protein
MATLLTPEPDLDEAEHLLANHRDRVPDHQRGLLIGPTVTLHLRRGDDRAAIELLVSSWNELEGLLPARALRLLELKWAFALHRDGNSSGARRHLEAAGTDVEREAAHLLDSWPELAAFVAQVGSYRRKGV